MRYVWMEKVDLKRAMSKRNGYKRTPIPQTNHKMRCRIRFVIENMIAQFRCVSVLLLYMLCTISHHSTLKMEASETPTFTIGGTNW
jgi:hypothetical protein